MGSVEFILLLMKELGNFMQRMSMSQCFPTFEEESPDFLQSTRNVANDLTVFDYRSIIQAVK